MPLIYLRLIVLFALLVIVVPVQARLIAHYDFTDGDLLDNEVSDVDYRLEQQARAPGYMAKVLLNRAEGTAVFPGGIDSVVWLSCDGPGELPEFTVSLWIRTDKVDQLNQYLGVIGFGRRSDSGSWQVHSDTRRQGNLRFRREQSKELVDISFAMQEPGVWHHLFIRKERSGSMVIYLTPEGGSAEGKGIRVEGGDSQLGQIALGSDCERKTSYRMEMADVQIYDSAEVSVQTLLAAGPQVRRPKGSQVWGISGHLDRLKTDEQELLNILRHLPVVEDHLQMDAYGYHSSFLPALEVLPESPRWTLSFSRDTTSIGWMREIYLIPAADRRSPLIQGYGFPQRFRIVGTNNHGESHTLADWRGRDFPNPERLPVRITGRGDTYHEIRLEVFRGCVEGGREFFALDEILLRGVSNVMPFQDIELSGSFEAPPFWSGDFLIDGKTSLGLPRLPGLDEKATDYLIEFEERLEQPFSLDLDLGENQRINHLALYPAQAPEGVVVPAYGFPRGVRIEYYRERVLPGERKLVKEYSEQNMQNPGNNVRWISAGGIHARWIRFSFDDFPEYKGREVFGLAEIEVVRNRESISTGCLVTTDAALGEAGLGMLTDGYAGGRETMPVLKWLDALSLRRDLGEWLDGNQTLQVRLEQRKDRFFINLAFFGAGSIILLLFGVIITGAVLRRRHSNLLRRRISQDLHDDIGSKVGAIVLASTFLRRAVADPQAQECGEDIEEIATDMKQALGDVLWFTNNKTDRLRELVCKLREIAEKTVPREMLEIHCTPIREVPEHPLRVEAKRELLMFFKEALHNAAKHGKPSRIFVEITWRRPFLHLCVQDDGRGFNVDEIREKDTQLGLDGMQRRAKRLHADLKINSAVGLGTVIQLKTKFRKL